MVDEVPVRFAVFDGEAAFGLTDGEPVEVREHAAVESLTSFFGSLGALWRCGQLLVGASEAQLFIVKRLVSGDTEDKIGRSLVASRRTVAAHVARIFRRLGSTSRARLGYLIARGTRSTRSTRPSWSLPVTSSRPPTGGRGADGDPRASGPARGPAGTRGWRAPHAAGPRDARNGEAAPGS